MRSRFRVPLLPAAAPRGSDGQGTLDGWRFLCGTLYRGPSGRNSLSGLVPKAMPQAEPR
jgi:hypothetical protein